MSVTLQYQLEKKKVKVTPSMTLRALLDRYCNERGFVASSFTLEHKGKKCDMALPFRLCGINNNSVLRVVPAVALAANARLKVALQTSDGTRLMAQFPMTTSLYQVLSYWESQATEHNFTKRMGPDPSLAKKKLGKDRRPVRYLQPVISTMSRSFDTFAALRSTTFTSLGVNGSCVCRLAFHFTDLEAVPAEATADDAGPVQAAVLERKPAPEQKEPVATQHAKHQLAATSAPPAVNTEVISPAPAAADGSCDRKTVVYKPSDTQMSIDSVEVSDDFFQMNSSDLRALKARMGVSNEQPLMTRAIREERALRAFQFAKTKIRVRFPDRWELEGIFLSSEGPNQLQTYVKAFLADPNADFELYTAPPKQNLQKTNFLKQRLTPAAIIYCSWVDKQSNAPFLSKKAKQQGVDRAPKPAEKSGSKKIEPSAKKKKKGGIPKWFKK